MFILVDGTKILAYADEIQDRGRNYFLGNGRFISKIGEIIDIGDTVIEDISLYQYVEGSVQLIPVTELDPCDFMVRFTDDEWKSFKDLAETDNRVGKFFDYILLASNIDLTKQYIIDEVNNLQTETILTSPRVSSIMA